MSKDKELDFKVEDFFKSDFIRHLEDFEDKSNEESIEIWNKFGERYIEEVFQFMTDTIYKYKELQENELNIKNTKKGN